MAKGYFWMKIQSRTADENNDGNFDRDIILKRGEYSDHIWLQFEELTENENDTERTLSEKAAKELRDGLIELYGPPIELTFRPVCPGRVFSVERLDEGFLLHVDNKRVAVGPDDDLSEVIEEYVL
jgi:hypothetical protein